MVAVGTVLLFSIVQSVFGMGLLVFGTPTLLLLGFDFYQTLTTLLPASIIISCLQLLENPSIERRFAKQFAVWCLPPLGLSLAALSVFGSTISLELVVGLLLLFFASFQLMPQLAARTRNFVLQNSTVWMVVMGMVHGVSNLGGGVLSVVASAYFRNKIEIRHCIAFCYLCFATVQLLILFIFKPAHFDWSNLLVMVLAGSVYLTVGRRTFKIISQFLYERLFLAFMYAYGLALITKSFF